MGVTGKMRRSREKILQLKRAPSGGGARLAGGLGFTPLSTGIFLFWDSEKIRKFAD